ncbi:hypothetical protein CYK37_11080 [Mesorhizobium loti]|nr:hypothetical protein CYK37_11080 [Mesorhizobium loti]
MLARRRLRSKRDDDQASLEGRTASEAVMKRPRPTERGRAEKRMTAFLIAAGKPSALAVIVSA